MELFQSRNQWDVLEKTHTARSYAKNAMIYWQETPAEEFYYLKSGKVKIFISSEDGAEKTLTVLEKGNLFGEAAFFDGLPRVSSSKALVPSQIVTITRNSLMDCIRREPQLAMELLTYLSQTIRMLSAQVNTLAFQQADRRLARLLMQLETPEGTVRATHEDLAALAGVSRVTVSRILSDFAQKGWIRTRYREIRIVRRQELEQL